jgi:hypothetical protein
MCEWASAWCDDLLEQLERDGFTLVGLGSFFSNPFNCRCRRKSSCPLNLSSLKSLVPSYLNVCPTIRMASATVPARTGWLQGENRPSRYLWPNTWRNGSGSELEGNHGLMLCSLQNANHNFHVLAALAAREGTTPALIVSCTAQKSLRKSSRTWDTSYPRKGLRENSVDMCAKIC